MITSVEHVVTKAAKESPAHQEEGEGFADLLKYTFAGYGGGIVLAVVLDYFGFQRNPIGQWIVRTISGESESVFEGIYALRQRLRRASTSMAEAYGWGKFVGITVPWIIDFISRQLGINVYGIQGFYIPFFYALSDQIGANVSGLIFLRRKKPSWSGAIAHYLRHPVMLTSLLIIVVVPPGLLIVRLAGFSPTTQVYTALETIAANICWLPPFVGWYFEKHAKDDEDGNGA